MGKYYDYRCWLPDRGDLFFVASTISDKTPCHLPGDAFVCLHAAEHWLVQLVHGAWNIYLSSAEYPGTNPRKARHGTYAEFRPPTPAEETAFALGGLGAVKQEGQP